MFWQFDNMVGHPFQRHESRRNVQSTRNLTPTLIEGAAKGSIRDKLTGSWMMRLGHLGDINANTIQHSILERGELL